MLLIVPRWVPLSRNTVIVTENELFNTSAQIKTDLHVGICNVYYIRSLDHVFLLLSSLYVFTNINVTLFAENEIVDLGVFFIVGISTLSGCGSPDQLDRLPELPAAEEKRLRRAAQILQQRLVLRQWLATHRLQHTYSKYVFEFTFIVLLPKSGVQV